MVRTGELVDGTLVKFKNDKLTIEPKDGSGERTFNVSPLFLPKVSKTVADKLGEPVRLIIIDDEVTDWKEPLI
jgi:hypothetical protein